MNPKHSKTRLAFCLGRDEIQLSVAYSALPVDKLNSYTRAMYRYQSTRRTITPTEHYLCVSGNVQSTQGILQRVSILSVLISFGK